jgi:CheY-like chemotaxis protein
MNSTSPRVLVVDDNIALAENIADILECEGFEATPVESPRIALETASRRVFDCVLLDVRMPEMDGIELRERLRASQPVAEFVFMTAYASDERLDAARRSGAAGILAKPFGPEALLRLLRVCAVRHAP